MRNLTLVTLLTSMFFASSAFADSRVLVCTKGTNKVEFGICGVRGCIASVSSARRAAVTYRVGRQKLSSGALQYTPTDGAARRCTFNISTLSNGRRSISNTPSCNTALRNARCVFEDRTDSSNLTR